MTVGDSVDGPMPVVGAGLVHNKRVVGGETPAAITCQAHYWALRQQARYLFVPSVGNRRWLYPECGVRSLRGSVVVVALLWWWGVVFDLWIVVASI